jgi:hypothetical protein
MILKKIFYVENSISHQFNPSCYTIAILQFYETFRNQVQYNRAAVVPEMSAVFSEELNEVDALVPVLVVENDNWFKLGILVGLALVPDEVLVIRENSFKILFQAGNIMRNFFQRHYRAFRGFSTWITDLS